MPKITFKKYQCSRCRFIKEIDTNHYGSCYSWGHFNTCPKCPPWAKYSEFGGSTTWLYLEKRSYNSEADEISNEELEAAMDMFDDLVDDVHYKKQEASGFKAKYIN